MGKVHHRKTIVSSDKLGTSLVSAWMENEIFGAVEEDVVAELAARYRPRTYNAGELVFESGAVSDRLFVLLKGAVRIFHRATDGRETVVKLLGAPCVFGDVEIISGVRFLESVNALGETLIAEIPSVEYLAFLDEHPKALWAQLRHASDKFCVAIHNERQCFDTLEEKIANVLLSYCEFFGTEKNDDAIIIEHPLSQKDIALTLGLVPRTVSNVIAKWKKSGVLGKKGPFVVVRQPQFLRDLVRPIGHGVTYKMGAPLDNLGHAPKTVSGVIKTVTEGEADVPGLVFSDECTIGAGSTCKIRVMEEGVSEIECRVAIGPTSQRFWIIGNEREVSVNGSKTKRALLHEGDLIQVGNQIFEFRTKKDSA